PFDACARDLAYDFNSSAEKQGLGSRITHTRIDPTLSHKDIANAAQIFNGLSDKVQAAMVLTTLPNAQTLTENLTGYNVQFPPGRGLAIFSTPQNNWKELKHSTFI